MSLPLPRKTPPKKMPRNRLHLNRRRATSAGSLGRIRAALYSLINFLLLDFRLGPPSLAASRQNTRNTHDRLVFTGERRGRGRHLLVVHGVYWIDIIRVLLLRIFQRAAGAFIQGLRGQNKAATPSRYARATRRSLRAHPPRTPASRAARYTSGNDASPRFFRTKDFDTTIGPPSGPRAAPF